MTEDRIHSPVRRRLALLAAAGLLCALPCAPSAQVLLASTSQDVSPSASPFVDDATVVRLEAGEPPRASRSEGHWLAVSGHVPGDVDGLALRPGFDPARRGALAFSLQANEAGFLDGDVLALAEGGGFELLVAEEVLAGGLGVPGAALDVDAIAWDDDGRLCFSLQSNLSGSILGDVLDGDVLRLEPDGSVVRYLSEEEVQARISAATGITSPFGDVQGLTFVDGEPWVAPQSPSSLDGGAIACGASPFLALMEETAGLDGAELDALCAVGSHPAVLSFAPHASPPGGAVAGTYVGGGPGRPVAVFASAASGYVAADYAGGFGAFYLDPADPWLVAAATSGLPVFVTDGAGEVEMTFTLPATAPPATGFGGEAGWTFQALDLVSLELTAPFRIGV